MACPVVLGLLPFVKVVDNFDAEYEVHYLSLLSQYHYYHGIYHYYHGQWGMLKLRDWPLQDWTQTDEVARVDIAALDNGGWSGKGGHCRTGHWRTEWQG